MPGCLSAYPCTRTSCHLQGFNPPLDGAWTLSRQPSRSARTEPWSGVNGIRVTCCISSLCPTFKSKLWLFWSCGFRYLHRVRPAYFMPTLIVEQPRAIIQSTSKKRDGRDSEVITMCAQLVATLTEEGQGHSSNTPQNLAWHRRLKHREEWASFISITGKRTTIWNSALFNSLGSSVTCTQEGRASYDTLSHGS